MLAPHLSYRALNVRPAYPWPCAVIEFFIPELIEHCLQGRDFPMSSGSRDGIFFMLMI
jgi:hypothetical protein